MFGGRKKTGSTTTGFPRRVVMYYLLFCLVAVAWLSAGIFFTVQTILSARSETACLTSLGRAAATIEIDTLRNGNDNTQALLQKLKSENQLKYAVVIGSDGRYLGHTEPDRVGKRAQHPDGKTSHQGEVQSVRVDDGPYGAVREFSVPLMSQGKPLGTLVIGAMEPELWGTVAQTAGVAPIAILLPLLLVACGAVVLGKLAAPVASVESELRRIAKTPIGQPWQPHSLPARSAISHGWNRLVDVYSRHQTEGDEGSLGSRLAAVATSHTNHLVEAAFDALPDGMAIADTSGNITFANYALPGMVCSQQQRDDLLGQPARSLLNTIASADVLKPLDDQAGSNRAVVVEIANAQAAGGRVLRVARHPLRDASGSLIGHVWCVRDITQQKLAESTREHFINAATHELRTPLANIKAYAETLLAVEELDVESQKEFCNTINSEATRLARFVDDLLSISSMEVGSLTIERQNVDTGRLVNEVVEKMRPLVTQKSLEFDIRLSEKMPEAALDKDKISATLVNLLGNAIKYTPAGGRVGLKAKVAETMLQIDVEDTGVGISEDEQPKVFEKFFRSKDPRVQDESGTGLGLSLAWEVVRLHGGDISLQSEPDKGSTFTVRLPLKAR